MTEQKFHRARRMFFVTPNGMMIAAQGDPRSHYEWLVSEFGDKGHEHYQNWTRGYWLGKRIVAYKGQDFEHWIDHEGFVEVIKVFKHLAIDSGVVILEVGIGISRSADRSTQPWEPKIVEDVDDYVEKVSRRKENLSGNIDAKGEGKPGAAN